jgi:hypothetical protein
VNAPTVLERVLQREGDGQGPADPFPVTRDEAAREFEWERLTDMSFVNNLG